MKITTAQIGAKRLEIRIGGVTVFTMDQKSAKKVLKGIKKIKEDIEFFIDTDPKGKTY